MSEKVQERSGLKLPEALLARQGKREPCGRCRRLEVFSVEKWQWQEEPGRWACPECADKFDDLAEAE